MANVQALLRVLEKRNELPSKGRRQVVEPPVPVPDSLPTLSPKHSRPMSPMLRERFAFAAGWENAFGATRWLSHAEMLKAAKDSRLLEGIAVIREDWDGAEIAELKPEQLAVFGHDVDQGRFTFLVWRTAAPEPEVIQYAGHEEGVYANLEEYLRWCLSE
jgi:hypothetical protein